MPIRERARSGILVSTLLCAALAAVSAARAAPPARIAEHRTGYDYYAIGALGAPRLAPAQPGMMLSGGGQWLRSSWAWFAERAGHGHLVILRASGDD
ncbi:MAG: peptidase T, partial [Proteobacteria bacterium]|nr:peptidase T [Pseudomonadota bacterium]